MHRPLASLLLLSAFTFFLGLGRPAITDSDEAFYAEASREMVESGDWLTPRFNYEDRWQKPVLYYWLTAATYLVTGPDEGSARAWAALSGLGLVLLTFVAARRMSGDERVAWLAGAIVATCFGCFAMARAALPDLPLAFCVTLTIWSSLRAAEQASLRWWAVAGAGAGLGFLLKGPVALAIPAMVLLPIWWRDRGRVVIRPLHVALAAAVFVVVGLPWYWAMLAEHGAAYARSFFLVDNFERFATDRFNEPRSIWFYVPVVLGGMLPWTLFAIALWMRPVGDVLRRVRRISDTEWRLLLWAMVPLVFFSISVGKQPRYILPVLPPLAILLASSLAPHFQADRAARSRGPFKAAGFATAALFVLTAALLVRVSPHSAGAGAAVLWASIGGLIAAATAIVFVLLRRAWPTLAPVLVLSSAVMVLAIQFAVLTPPRPEAVERMADLVRHHRAGHERVGVYRAFVRNLVFYAQVQQADLFDESLAVDFVKSGTRVLLVVPARDRPALEAASGVTLYELGAVDYVNTANLRLRTVIRGGLDAEAVKVVLVTNR